MISLVKIPEMDCEPKYSILRLPTGIDSTLDSGNLVAAYSFVADDMNSNWWANVYDSDKQGSEGQVAMPCAVGSTIHSDKDFIYLSYLSSALYNMGERAWVIGNQSGEYLPCNYDGSSDGTGGEDGTEAVKFLSPVSYATNRPSFLPTPTFNPNQSAGAGVGGGPLSVGRIIDINYEDQTAEVAYIYIDSAGNLRQDDSRTITVRIL